MQIKHNTRWYVTRPPMSAAGYLLMQASSSVPIGWFVDRDEALWVCNRLNAGRRLCIAVGNILDHDMLLSEHANGLVDDLLEAVTEYKRDSNIGDLT